MQVNFTPNFVPNIPKKSPNAVNNSGASKLGFGRTLTRNEAFNLRDEITVAIGRAEHDKKLFDFEKYRKFLVEAYRDSGNVAREFIRDTIEIAGKAVGKTPEEILAGIR